MKHTQGKWKKMDYWFPCYIIEPIHLENKGQAYSIQKLPYYSSRGWKFGLVDVDNPDQIKDEDALGFARTLKIAKARIAMLIAKAEGCSEKDGEEIDSNINDLMGGIVNAMSGRY